MGVVAFELVQMRALQLIFTSTFENVFIAYEAVRSGWSTLRFLGGLAARGGRVNGWR